MSTIAYLIINRPKHNYESYQSFIYNIDSPAVVSIPNLS